MPTRRESVRPSLRHYIKRRDGNACVSCGSRRNLSLHHIKPVAEGGAQFDPANIKTLCHRCHSERHV